MSRWNVLPHHDINWPDAYSLAARQTGDRDRHIVAWVQMQDARTGIEFVVAHRLLG
jgi:hypothetical protein